MIFIKNYIIIIIESKKEIKNIKYIKIKGVAKMENVVFDEIKGNYNLSTASEVIENIVYCYSEYINSFEDLAVLVGNEGMKQFMEEYEYSTYNDEVISVLTLLLERMHDGGYTIEETLPLAKVYVDILSKIV